MQAEWNKLKHDVGNVDEFIASHKDKPDDSQQIRDFGLKAVSSAATRYSCDSTTVVSQSSSSYEPSVSLYYDTKLFDVLCPTVPIMTEDIKNNQSFISCVKSAEPAVLYFVNLKKQYTHSKQRERQTALRKDLEAIDADIAMVVDNVKKISELKLNPSLGLDSLAQTCVQKQKLLSQLAQSLLVLKSRVSSPELLNNLHRRLKQQKKIISNEYIVKCLHTSNFTWEEAYLELDMAENAGLRSYPLDFAALRLIMYKLGEL